MKTAAKPVVCLSAAFPPPAGGMRVQADMIAKALEAAGIKMVLLPTMPAPPEALRFVQFVPVLRTIVRSVTYLAKIPRAVRRADVIHLFTGSTHGVFAYAVPLVFASSLWKKRLLVHYHSGGAETFMRRWGWIAAPVLRRADIVAVPSPFLRRIFEKHDVTTAVLPNVANVERFPFRERRQLQPRLLVSRHLEPIYDIETTLLAFRMVQAKYPNATLGIAGGGSEEARLKQLARELDLRGLTFYGRVPNHQMPALYGKYDIAVNSSTVDNFPVALLEAALSGLPIVSSEAGGIPDIIEHGRTGLLVRVKSPECLANGVLHLLEHPEEAHAISLRARRWAEQYSMTNVLPILLGLYGFAKNTASSAARSAVAAG